MGDLGWTPCRMEDAGEMLSAEKLDNDPIAIALDVAKAGPDPEVAVEATLWRVLARRCAPRFRRECVRRPLARRADVSTSAGQERPARRRTPRGPVAHGTTARSMDRTARDVGAAGAGASSREAGRATDRAALPSACDPRQGRRDRPDERPLRSARTQLLDELDLARAYEKRVRSLRELLAVHDREIDTFERDTHEALPGPCRLRSRPNHSRCRAQVRRRVRRRTR